MHSKGSDQSDKRLINARNTVTFPKYSSAQINFTAQTLALSLTILVCLLNNFCFSNIFVCRFGCTYVHTELTLLSKKKKKKTLLLAAGLSLCYRLKSHDFSLTLIFPPFLID